MEKRRKDGACFKCTRRATIAEIVESLELLESGGYRKDTGNKGPKWYKSGELKTDFSPRIVDSYSSPEFSEPHAEERSDVRHLYNAGQDFEIPYASSGR